jgi:hypothetical protein
VGVAVGLGVNVGRKVAVGCGLIPETLEKLQAKVRNSVAIKGAIRQIDTGYMIVIIKEVCTDVKSNWAACHHVTAIHQSIFRCKRAPSTSNFEEGPTMKHLYRRHQDFSRLLPKDLDRVSRSSRLRMASQLAYYLKSQAR